MREGWAKPTGGINHLKKLGRYLVYGTIALDAVNLTNDPTGDFITTSGISLLATENPYVAGILVAEWGVGFIAGQDVKIVPKTYQQLIDWIDAHLKYGPGAAAIQHFNSITYARELKRK